MTPKIKIVGPLQAGTAVYLTEGGKAFTTEKSGAAKAYPQTMGHIVMTKTGPQLKLNAFTEGALSSLE